MKWHSCDGGINFNEILIKGKEISFEFGKEFELSKIEPSKNDQKEE